ncbi:uncharacterized protein LOC106767160 isoform X1 [Vigna radiata var. radiata]|uniref:Uncharacterized protein LOC106767160 isoform X1 n=1 Tax=Vigna radiata var. radiata TaxID=3916 RepID=A0A1S3UNG7_VIGRR|nr:uncharacterized protein LOC106767160 isoform X1 [Vigna radiata var. radiata]
MLAQERMARILVWFGGVASTVPMIYACLILWQLKADIYKLNRLSKTIDDLENKMSQMKKLSSTSSSPSPSDKSHFPGVVMVVRHGQYENGGKIGWFGVPSARIGT